MHLQSGLTSLCNLRCAVVKSFSEIWRSPQAVRVRKTIRDSPWMFSFCQNCPYADRDVNTCSIEVHRIAADMSASVLISGKCLQ
jgi:hypothetical protein